LVAEVENAKTTPDLTVSEIVSRYCTTAGVQPRTTHGYRQVATYLGPLGSIDAATARVVDVESRLIEVAAEVGSGTAVALHRLLRAAWNDAVRLELVASSPMGRVKPPKHTAKKVEGITPAQVVAIIAREHRPGRSTLFRVAAATGCRRGELAALGWSDIDFGRSVLTVERAVSMGEVKGTKTGVVKRISLDAGTVAALTAWRVAIEIDRQQLGLPPLDDDEWIWARADGGPIHPDTITGWWTVARRGIADGARFHDLRHFAASMMLAAGVDVVTAAQRQGHSPQVMLQTYAHALPEADRLAAEVLGDALG
jgi:integrase